MLDSRKFLTSLSRAFMKAGDGFAPQGTPAASRVRVVPAAAMSPGWLECPPRAGAVQCFPSVAGFSSQHPVLCCKGLASRAWGQ